MNLKVTLFLCYAVLRLNHCTDCNEILHRDTFNLEERYTTHYSDNPHARRRNRHQNLVNIKPGTSITKSPKTNLKIQRLSSTFMKSATKTICLFHIVY